MRLFVALDLPPALRQRLATLTGGLSGARWVPPENYHVTLRFIGEAPAWRAEEIDQFFTEVMNTVQATVITNASLGFDFRQRFRPLRMHQVVPELKSYDFRPVSPTNRHTDIALGDIQKEGMTLLVQYTYEGGAGFANEFQVAGVTLTYDMPPQTGLTVRSDDFTALFR